MPASLIGGGLGRGFLGTAMYLRIPPQAIQELMIAFGLSTVTLMANRRVSLKREATGARQFQQLSPPEFR
jgi:hypothetical protein